VRIFRHQPLRESVGADARIPESAPRLRVVVDRTRHLRGRPPAASASIDVKHQAVESATNAIWSRHALTTAA
jgi:hypothetical protein